MTDSMTQSFHVLRRIDQTDAGPVFEAAPETDLNVRVTVWSGIIPNVPLGIHPILAVPIGRGRNERQPLWVEDRPPGCLMVDIKEPLSLYDAAHIVSQIAEGLTALHSRRLAHGSVNPTRIVLDRDGSPTLIGTGVTAGTPASDLQDVLKLFHGLAPDGPAIEAADMASLTAQLRELSLSADRSASTLAEMLAKYDNSPPPEATTIRLMLDPVGFTDEVKVDVGPDRSERGLLDRWSNTASIEDLTGDQTESISASELAARAQEVLLDRVTALYAASDLANRFAANEGTGCAPIRALINDEPLDPIPVPEGVPYIPTPIADDGEHTAEVTAEAPPALRYSRTEETTGWTNSVELTSPRGMSPRWEWAIAGALATLMILAVVALVIALVFV